MKQLFFSVLLIVQFSVASASWLDSTSKWYFTDVSVFNGNVSYYFRTYFLDGDTVINGKVWHKEYLTTIDSAVNIFPVSGTTVTTTGPFYVKALREDSLNRYIATYEYNTAEFIVEDFNLTVGDTILGGCIITSMDSFLFDGVYRKRFFPDWPYDYVYVEGIGETRPCGMIMEGASSLCAYTTDRDTFVAGIGCMAPYFNHFLSPTSIETLPDENIFNVFPNPTCSAECYVDIKQEGYLQMIDFVGRIILDKSLQTGKHTLELKEIGAGSYSLIFRTKSGTVTRTTFFKL